MMDRGTSHAAILRKRLEIVSVCFVQESARQRWDTFQYIDEIYTDLADCLLNRTSDFEPPSKY